MKTSGKPSSHGQPSDEGGEPSVPLSLRARFHALCVAIEIVRKRQTVEQFYADKEKTPLVMTLIRHEFGLVADGSLSLKKKTGSGLLKMLQNESTVRATKLGKPLSHEPVAEGVRRLFGFVRDERGWTLLPLKASEKGRHRQVHYDAYCVVPTRIRERIFRLWTSNPAELEAYIAQATAYLRKPHGDPLPELPWNQPAEFENGHEFIYDFLGCVEVAKPGTVITVASINNYITASIGRKLFLHALRREVRIRFLIFDFLNGDATGVAKMIHRPPDAFFSNAFDTVEALLKLQEDAEVLGCAKNLEVRLLDDDPVGRWYVLDAPSKPMAFFALRTPNKASKSADAAGGKVVGQAARAQAEVVDNLWAKAGAKRHQLEHWRKTYDGWKAKPETRRMLGLDDKE